MVKAVFLRARRGCLRAVVSGAPGLGMGQRLVAARVSKRKRLSTEVEQERQMDVQTALPFFFEELVFVPARTDPKIDFPAHDGLLSIDPIRLAHTHSFRAIQAGRSRLSILRR